MLIWIIAEPMKWNITMNNLIRLSKSIISRAEMDAVQAVMESAYLGMSIQTRDFEKEIAQYLGNDRHVVCVNTGTSALQCALQAIGCGVGDEVLVPTLTFVACFQAISATGATPIACDVDIHSGLLDLHAAEKRITPRTKAMMPVHYASHVGDLKGIYQFAEKHNLRVIEDAAHAFGCEYDGKKIGAQGDVVCFSFDGIKNITCGEGGAVVSSDPELIRMIQDIRVLGVQNDTEKRYSRKRSWDFDVTEQGWRYHMSDIMAAIGRVQLTRLDNEFKPKRIALAKQYRELLKNVESVVLLETDIENVVPHILPIRVIGGKRNEVRDGLLQQNIEVGMHYKLNHQLSKYHADAALFPVAEQLYQELLTLPLHPDLDESEVADIVGSIKALV